MCDNLSTDQENKIIEESKNSCIFLKEFAIEFEDKLHSIIMLIKSNNELLIEKEQELNEIERIKDHNIDIFSPIQNRSKMHNKLIDDINEIKDKIKVLENQKLELEERINGINGAANCIDNLSTNLINYKNDKESKFKQRMTDKGLSILEAQEVERQRIARDLHDSTVQNLTSLVHKSELCIKLIDIDIIRAKLELNSMSNTLKMVINDMRGIIYNLKPMTLDDLGLTITVQRYANKLMNINNIEIKVTSNEEVKEILSVIKLTVFRIIQEACNNIIKHAKAKLIEIDISYEENRLNVTVNDDGVGFTIEHEKDKICEQSSSFGLSIMQERISLLSGSINIKSEKGKGTIVNISVPLSIYEGENK